MDGSTESNPNLDSDSANQMGPNLLLEIVSRGLQKAFAELATAI